jgi:hypothetical protein
MLVRKPVLAAGYEEHRDLDEEHDRLYYRRSGALIGQMSSMSEDHKSFQAYYKTLQKSIVPPTMQMQMQHFTRPQTPR